MALACETRSDYEVLIREEYFPFWDEETKTVWTEGLKGFTELCGSPPDADVEDHDILCQLLVDRGLALKFTMTAAKMEDFLRLDDEIKARSLCFSSDYFIATAGVAREILIEMASERCAGGGK
jgi:hypothetical protein